jgi:hypothetical protein
MRRRWARSMVFVIGALATACSKPPVATQVESSAKPVVLGADDFRFLIETGATTLLSVTTADFSKQELIPVELDGCEGELPRLIFGKPAQLVADLSTVLDYDLPTMAMRLVVLEQRGDDLKIRLSHIAMTYSANAEAWVSRADGNWRISEVLGRWRNL